MELKTYQQNCINNILVNYDSSSSILLKSPTGSGKTVMMVYLIKELIDIKPNAVFLWISSRPKLINQSKQYAINEHLNVVDVDDLPLKSGGLSPSDILYVNWEKIKNKTNTLRIVSSTNVSFDEVLERTHEKGLEVILINDESHYGSDTELVNELINEIIKPFKRIDISATPSQKPYCYTHEITLEEVRESEIIKKGIQINKDIEEYTIETRAKHNIESLTEYIVHSGLTKHEELRDIHDKVGKGIKPLLLIQLPNNENTTYNEVTRYLSKRGYSESNNKVGIHLNNYSNVDVNNIPNDVEVLIFKQALSMGWDNPRSHVLIMLRESSNTDFIIQTLGRILRNPYQEYFNDEFSPLNYAYLYLLDNNIDGIEEIEKSLLESDLGLLSRKDIESNIDKLELIEMVDDSNMLVRLLQFNKLIPKFINSKNFEIVGELEKNDVKKYILKDSFTTSNTYTDTLEVEDYIEVSDLTINDLINRITKLLEKNIYPELTQTIFNSLTTSTKFAEYNDLDKLKNIYKNLHYYIYQLNRFIYVVDRRNNRFTKEYINWESPRHFNGTMKNYSTETIDNCLYENYKINGSEVEMLLMEYLKSSTNVKTWYKNGDIGNEHFRIPYLYKGVHRNHYPDFLIETVDGEVIIIETKTNYMDESTLNKYIFTRKYVTEMQERQEIQIKNYLVKNVDGNLLMLDSEVRKFQELTSDGKWKEFSI